MNTFVLDRNQIEMAIGHFIKRTLTAPYTEHVELLPGGNPFTASYHRDLSEEELDRAVGLYGS